MGPGYAQESDWAQGCAKGDRVQDCTQTCLESEWSQLTNTPVTGQVSLWSGLKGGALSQGNAVPGIMIHAPECAELGILFFN